MDPLAAVRTNAPFWDLHSAMSEVLFSQMLVAALQWEVVVFSEPARFSYISDRGHDALVEVSFGADEFSLKWPNDVLINGKKIAGILLEVADSNVEEPSVIIGIGINISKAPGKVEYPVSRINDYKNGHISADDVLITLLHHFVYWFHIWEDIGFGAIQDEWMRRAFKLDGNVSVENNNGEMAVSYTHLTLPTKRIV